MWKITEVLLQPNPTQNKYLCCPAGMTNSKITRQLKKVLLLLLLLSLLLSLLLLLCVSGSH